MHRDLARHLLPVSPRQASRDKGGLSRRTVAESRGRNLCSKSKTKTNSQTPETRHQINQSGQGRERCSAYQWDLGCTSADEKGRQDIFISPTHAHEDTRRASSVQGLAPRERRCQQRCIQPVSKVCLMTFLASSPAVRA